MSLRVGFDVDGVLADFRTAFRNTAAKMARRGIAAKGGAADESALSADEVRRVWEQIAKHSNWWMDVEAYEADQIARLYALSRAACWEVFFLTKRPPSAGDAVQFQTQWWIERHGFYLPSVLTVPGSRGEVANALRLDLLVDDQLINCVEVVSASPAKAILMQRTYDATEKTHAMNRGIGVVATLSSALQVIERLQDIVTHKRGRLLRLNDWFQGPDESRTLPQNPRAVRPVPPFDRSTR
jgi:hypothetical protein